MEVHCAVEPGLFTLTRDFHNKRISFPVADRPAHPRSIGRLWVATKMDDASRGRKLIRDQDLIWSLNNLKREAHVRGARNARHITFGLGVADRLIDLASNGTNESLFEILLFLCFRPSLIWDLTALNDAEPCGHRTDGAGKCRERRRSRSMGLKVPIGAVMSLPDPAQIGVLRTNKTRRPIRLTWCLTRAWNQSEPEDPY